jgi:hypothetical protein
VALTHLSRPLASGPAPDSPGAGELLEKTKGERRQAASRNIYAKMPPAKQKGAVYNGKTITCG